MIELRPIINPRRHHEFNLPTHHDTAPELPFYKYTDFYTNSYSLTTLSTLMSTPEQLVQTLPVSKLF
jgi:hypothetical protein